MMREARPAPASRWSHRRQVAKPPAHQIDELTSTGKSMMPEGLEKDLPLQEMADLIAFVRGNLPGAEAQEVPGE